MYHTVDKFNKEIFLIILVPSVLIVILIYFVRINSPCGQLFRAIENANIKTVEKILKKNGDCINIKMNSFSPLYKSVFFKNKKITKLLIDYGADVNSINGRHNYSPLFVAAGNGDVEIMDLLIRNFANVNQNDSQKKTPLMIASINGHANAIELLIKSGSNINAKSKYNKKTALVFAAESGHFNCVKTLIAFGANEEINIALKNAKLRLSGIPAADNDTKEQYRMIIELLKKN